MQYVRGRCRTAQHVSGDVPQVCHHRRLQADADASGPFDYDVVRVTQKDGDRVAALKAQRLSLERRLVRLREAFLAGVDTMEEYRQSKDETTAAIQNIDRAIAETNTENRRIGDPRVMRNAIRDALAVITDEVALFGAVASRRSLHHRPYHMG